jgi:hypothetical protein
VLWPPPPGGSYPPAPPAPVKVDGFAITSLIFGLVGGVIFSVGFGIAALRRIHRRERRGRGLAIAGLWLSLVWVVGLVAVLSFDAGRHPARTSDGAVTKPGVVSPGDVRSGDCLEVPREVGTIRSLPIMPCSDPHNAQVFQILTAPDGAFPGDDALESSALDLCRSASVTFLGTSRTALHIVVFVPTSSRWSDGDRSEACLLVDRQQDFTGDVRVQA